MSIREPEDFFSSLDWEILQSEPIHYLTKVTYFTVLKHGQKDRFIVHFSRLSKKISSEMSCVGPEGFLSEKTYFFWINMVSIPVWIT